MPILRRHQAIASLLNQVARRIEYVADRFTWPNPDTRRAAADLILIGKTLWKLARILYKPELPSRHGGAWRITSGPDQAKRCALYVDLYPATERQRTQLHQQASSGRTGFVALRWEQDHLRIVLTGLHVKEFSK